MTAEGSRGRFGRLSSGERQLAEAAAAGRIARLAKDETVRAEFLVALATEMHPEEWPVAPQGVRLAGGRIEGRVRLDGRTVPKPLWLRWVQCPHGIDLRDARTKTLIMTGICIGALGLDCSGARVDGWIDLSGADIAGCLDFNSTGIEGPLSAKRATIRVSVGQAISAQHLFTTGVFLDGATITGCCDFSGAEIDGQFSASEKASFTNAGGDAILAQGLSATDVFLDGATITGCCGFSSAKIDGQFSANEKASFTNAGGNAILAPGLSATGVILDGATITGCCDLSWAKIDGQVSATQRGRRDPDHHRSRCRRLDSARRRSDLLGSPSRALPDEADQSL